MNKFYQCGSPARRRRRWRSEEARKYLGRNYRPNYLTNNIVQLIANIIVARMARIRFAFTHYVPRRTGLRSRVWTKLFHHPKPLPLYPTLFTTLRATPRNENKMERGTSNLSSFFEPNWFDKNYELLTWETVAPHRFTGTHPGTFPFFPLALTQTSKDAKPAIALVQDRPRLARNCK